MTLSPINDLRSFWRLRIQLVCRRRQLKTGFQLGWIQVSSFSKFFIIGEFCRRQHGVNSLLLVIFALIKSVFFNNKQYKVLNDFRTLLIYESNIAVVCDI